ncbi:autotransporter assembly complex family protein [Sessilibacter sp. MAH4]
MHISLAYSNNKPLFRKLRSNTQGLVYAIGYTCLGLVASFIPAYQVSALALFDDNSSRSEIKIETVGGEKDATLLKKMLQEELSRQHKDNEILKLYSNQNKIANYERTLLNEFLRSKGYYSAKISSQQIDGKISHVIQPGKLYVINKIDIELPEGVPPIPDNYVLLKTGDPLVAEKVLIIQDNLTTWVKSNSCLYQVKVVYKAKIFPETGNATLTYSTSPSPATTFGPVTFSGLRSIDEAYLRDRMNFTSGECYNRAQLDEFRLVLLQSNLLASAVISTGEITDDGVPITIDVTERNHRTISAGFGFRTDEGFGVSTGWEHRNLFGRAENLDLNAYIAQNRQALTSNYTIPHYRFDEQSLTLFAEIESEQTDAFDSDTASFGVELSRQISDPLRASLGIQTDLSQVTESDGDRDDFALVSLPFNAEYDKRNAALDPRTGWVAGVGLQPFLNITDTNIRFLKTTAAGSYYKTFDNTFWKPTFAVRGAVGSISGTTRDEVPATERFYVGGGGSVRGYPYQTLGPLDGNDPEGGLSYTEVSFETRLHWGDTWGGVVFLDGGNAYNGELPRLGEDLRFGTGVGLRFYTSFAPIRFDVAFPLDRREEIDDSFQIYISLGQAF